MTMISQCREYLSVVLITYNRHNATSKTTEYQIQVSTTSGSILLARAVVLQALKGILAVTDVR